MYGNNPYHQSSNGKVIDAVKIGQEEVLYTLIIDLIKKGILSIFSVTVTALTATSGSDFQQIQTTTVTFQPRETGRKPVTINIIDDQILENDEQFLVFIASSDSDTRVVTSSATVTIEDDDCE